MGRPYSETSPTALQAAEALSWFKSHSFYALSVIELPAPASLAGTHLANLLAAAGPELQRAPLEQRRSGTAGVLPAAHRFPSRHPSMPGQPAEGHSCGLACSRQQLPLPRGGRRGGSRRRQRADPTCSSARPSCWTACSLRSRARPPAGERLGTSALLHLRRPELLPVLLQSPGQHDPGKTTGCRLWSLAKAC